jgi:hypothetical protein
MRAQGFSRQAASLGEYLVKVVAPQGEFPKPRQRGLLPKLISAVGYLRFVHAALSDRGTDECHTYIMVIF